MRIALIAPSGVPFSIGGAEKTWRALHLELVTGTTHAVEMIRLPSPEQDFWSILRSYETWSRLDLSHFDMVISGKYPAWMVQHPRHVVWQLHCLRGLYDTYPKDAPQAYPSRDPLLRNVAEHLEVYRGKPESLPDFFALMRDLRGQETALPPELFTFPGPLIRDIVNYLDSIGLARERIYRYAAISETVRRRRAYRPNGVEVRVAMPPTDLTNLRRGEGKHLLMVSRLDPAKRIGLCVQAMRLARTDIPLKIVGTGPEEAHLRQLAQGDPRIEFLGFVDDGQLEQLYADALAVIFTPFDEDFGIIAAEAMLAGKPVVTSIDSGGPTELIRPGLNGVVAEQASPEALARAIEDICRSGRRAEIMGRRGYFDARSITWNKVVRTLLDEPLPRKRIRVRAPAGRRRKLLVANTFAFYPPLGGGQARHHHLLTRASQDLDITYVALVGADRPTRVEWVTPTLQEISIPKSAAHDQEENALSRALDWAPVTDVAAPILCHLTPDFMDTLAEEARSADLLGAFHPYLAGALQEVSDRPLWHDSANVEFLLKRDLLPSSPQGADLVLLTRQVEEIACRDSSLLTACSEDDAVRLAELYDICPGSIRLVENGVDAKTVAFADLPQRAALRARLFEKLGHTATPSCRLALFLASWHGPNLDGAKQLMAIAGQTPEVIYVLVGSAGQYFKDKVTPPNVLLLGVVSETQKNLLLQACDFAVNPMPYGSGTNVKMLEYFAAGAPVLSTAAGARGLAGAIPGRDYLLCDFNDFANGVAEMLELREVALREMAHSARRLVEQRYDWDAIYQRLRASLPEDILG